MHAQRETWYQRLKRRMLNNRFVAILVLAGVVLAALATCITHIETISNLIRKKAVLSVALEGPARTQRFKQEIYQLEVALNTDKPVVIDDVEVMLSFSAAGGTHFSAAESISHFAVPSLPILVRALSRASPKRIIPIPIRAQRAGEYVLEVHAVSRKHRLKSAVTHGLVVDPMDFSKYVKAAPAESPLFISENGIADAAPGFFDRSFEILLPEIAGERGLFHATLWFEPDYIGALGGAVWRIFASSWSATGDSDEAAYLESLRHLTERQPDLNEVGILEMGSASIPLGNLFYDIKMIDPQRIRIVPREPICHEVSARVVGPAKFTLPDALNRDAIEWIIPEIPLQFLIGYDCGADGRNCLLELEVNGKIYREFDSIEFLTGSTGTDFPFLLKLDDRRYIRFSNPTGMDKVSVSMCEGPE